MSVHAGLTRRDYVREGPLTAFDKELMEESTWYLVDTREPEKVAAKTLLTAGPKREIYKVVMEYASNIAACAQGTGVGALPRGLVRRVMVPACFAGLCQGWCV